MVYYQGSYYVVKVASTTAVVTTTTDWIQILLKDGVEISLTQETNALDKFLIRKVYNDDFAIVTYAIEIEPYYNLTAKGYTY